MPSRRASDALRVLLYARSLGAVARGCDLRVAPAGHRLQAPPIENPDPATAVPDQPALLQRLDRPIDRGTPHAERVRPEILSEREFLRQHPVAGQQQPSGEARLRRMEAVASNGSPRER